MTDTSGTYYCAWCGGRYSMCGGAGVYPDLCTDCYPDDDDDDNDKDTKK